MYEAFYGLSAEPFRLTPDHRFSFRHRSYARAKAYLEYGVRRAEGFVMITGRPGTGKTTLIDDLLASLKGAGVSIARLVSTQVEAGELLRLVAFSFGLDAEGADKATLLRRLEMFLREEAQAGRRAVLIVDEAQDVSAGALEELRLLTNLVHQGQPLLQVFLVGQAELRAVVRSKALEQLHQRLIAACHLEPLNLRECRAYIQYRLKRVGWQGDPAFADELYEGVHAFSQGVPRRINQVCSRLLLHGFVGEKHRLDGADLEAVIDDLREEMLTPWDEEADTRGRRVPARGEEAEFRFDPADLDPPLISDEESKKKDRPEPLGLTSPPGAGGPDLGEPLPCEPSGESPPEQDPLPEGASATTDDTEPSPPAEREHRQAPATGAPPTPRAVPLARIATTKVPAHKARRGMPEQEESGPWPFEARARAGRGTVHGDPATSLNPEQAPAPGRTVAARRAGAALVAVLGALALILAALLVMRSVPGPWSPGLDRAESWLRGEWALARTRWSGDFLPPPPEAPGAPSRQMAQPLTVQAPPPAASAVAAEPPYDRPIRPDPGTTTRPDPGAVASTTQEQQQQGGRFEPVSAARAELSAKAGADGRGVVPDDPLAQIRRTVREQLADVGLTLWPQADGSLYLDFIEPISFGSDSATLADDQARVLARLSGVLRAHPAVKVRLVGWTDTRGDPIYNQYLSEQRAGTVAELLREQGLDSRRLEVEGRGAVTPGLFDPQASRRVDLYLTAP
ncbi:XrtA/PEP-CTERM system-associated ATPase [Alkalilimnicola sp. S0819]|uniref:XrtA/PEP-CTERM system-associated ATPase n=1 Tax=Alkalilimnicola sp. S0819 TaxID=2613922 RepID=UPI001262A54A|nr:XrtA/PEP-CTERM system-associated ATPase [Alkalilimnicola sp. S0819]KAB7623638.1 AAA family ATPase [Alkalilimnicola sp. S0819]MPQ16762.1 AAA family ATPase [Alkalilimnicola sp. S0819]